MGFVPGCRPPAAGKCSAADERRGASGSRSRFRRSSRTRAASEQFPSSDRLRRAADFRRLSAVGRRSSDRFFVVLVAAAGIRENDGPEAPARLGITVSRRVGNAVVRNRLKRQIREWFRRHRRQLRAGLDFVVIGRVPVATATPDQIGESLREHVLRLEVVNSDARHQRSS